MNKKGFTLVEILAVISILALIMIIVGTNGFGAFNNSKKKINEMTLSEIKESVNVVMTEVINCDDDLDKELIKFLNQGDNCENLQTQAETFCINVKLKDLIEKKYITGSNVKKLYEQENDMSFRGCIEKANNSNVIITCNNCGKYEEEFGKVLDPIPDDKKIDYCDTFDLNGDNEFDTSDYGLIQFLNGVRKEYPEYDVKYDVDKDGVININDTNALRFGCSDKISKCQVNSNNDLIIDKKDLFITKLYNGFDNKYKTFPTEMDYNKNNIIDDDDLKKIEACYTYGPDSCVDTDVNGDGITNDLDYEMLLDLKGKTSEDSEYDTKYDLIKDNIIDTKDIVKVMACKNALEPDEYCNKNVRKHLPTNFNSNKIISKKILEIIEKNVGKVTEENKVYDVFESNEKVVDFNDSYDTASCYTNVCYNVDFNRNNRYDVDDMNEFNKWIGATTSTKNFSPKYDLDKNNAITTYDLAMILSCWGNEDGKVDYMCYPDKFTKFDRENLYEFLDKLGTEKGTEGYDAKYDFNNDYYINNNDLVKLGTDCGVLEGELYAVCDGYDISGEGILDRHDWAQFNSIKELIPLQKDNEYYIEAFDYDRNEIIDELDVKSFNRCKKVMCSNKDLDNDGFVTNIDQEKYKPLLGSNNGDTTYREELDFDKDDSLSIADAAEVLFCNGIYGKSQSICTEDKLKDFYYDDIYNFLDKLGTKKGTTGYNAKYDFDKNDRIDNLDLIEVNKCDFIKSELTSVCDGHDYGNDGAYNNDFAEFNKIKDKLPLAKDSISYIEAFDYDRNEIINELDVKNFNRCHKVRCSNRDLNKDGKVDSNDQDIITSLIGSIPGDSEYKVEYDLYIDDNINTRDFSEISVCYNIY